MKEDYQSAHLMVAPSLHEGMSIAALEALACGVYLIATVLVVLKRYSGKSERGVRKLLSLCAPLFFAPGYLITPLIFTICVKILPIFLHIRKKVNYA